MFLLKITLMGKISKIKKAPDVILFVSLTLSLWLVPSSSVFGQTDNIRLENIRQLTDGSPYLTFPKWSPDGKRIAAEGRKPDGIFVMNADGTNLEQITGNISAGARFEWLHNSEMIAYTVTYTNQQGNNQLPSLTSEVSIVNIHSKNTTLLHKSKNVSRPVITRDKHLWFYDNGSKKTYLFNDRGEKQNASAINEKVYFVSSSLRLTEMNLNGTGVKVIDEHEQVHFVKSIPGQPIVVYDTRNSGLRIWNIVDESSQLVDMHGSYPSASTDGRYIFYSALIDQGTRDDSAIFVFKSYGTGKTQLTFESEIFETRPDISPDGKKILFASLKSGKIFIADVIYP